MPWREKTNLVSLKKHLHASTSNGALSSLRFGALTKARLCCFLVATTAVRMKNETAGTILSRVSQVADDLPLSDACHLSLKLAPS